MEVTRSSDWYWKNLGDGLQASTMLQQIRQKVLQYYPDAQQNQGIAVFWRQISTNGLHCEVNIYFSPMLRKIAKQIQACPCIQPVGEGLECLIGNQTILQDKPS